MLTNILKGILNLLSPFNAIFSVWARNLAASFIAFMTLMILLQVFYRYVLNDSFSWTEELAKILMVWSAFLVAPWAYRMGANVSIELFFDSFSQRFRLVMQLVLNCLVIWIIVKFFQEAIDFWLRGFSVTSASMPIAMGWFYTVLPIGFLGIILVGIELLLRDLLSLLDREGDYSIPDAGVPQEGE